MEVHGKSVEFKYTCQYCNEVFPLKEMYDYHIKSKHERSVIKFYNKIVSYHYYKIIKYQLRPKNAIIKIFFKL